jgi:hypothetical protein
MRVRRDGWRRDRGRFMRSRVVVVVGVVLLEPWCVDNVIKEKLLYEAP